MSNIGMDFLKLKYNFIYLHYLQEDTNIFNKRGMVNADLPTYMPQALIDSLFQCDFWGWRVLFYSSCLHAQGLCCHSPCTGTKLFPRWHVTHPSPPTAGWGERMEKASSALFLC